AARSDIYSALADLRSSRNSAGKALIDEPVEPAPLAPCHALAARQRKIEATSGATRTAVSLIWQERRVSDPRCRHDRALNSLTKIERVSPFYLFTFFHGTSLSDAAC